jgi:hypothetical protein
MAFRMAFCISHSSWPARYGIRSPFSGLVYCSVVTGMQHLQLRAADSVLDLLTSVARDNGWGFLDLTPSPKSRLAIKSVLEQCMVRWPRLPLDRDRNGTSPTGSCGQHLGPAHLSEESDGYGFLDGSLIHLGLMPSSPEFCLAHHQISSVQSLGLPLDGHWNVTSGTESCRQHLGPAGFSDMRQWTRIWPLVGLRHHLGAILIGVDNGASS